jgi:DSHCT (NUC185) domain
VLNCVCARHFRWLLLLSDLSNCEVVTAWADGCSWSEALQISGAPPGDLVRTLSRVLDAVRQFGNLPYSPMRKPDFLDDSSTCRGLHPDIRRLCRDAARAINRYPVKDPLAFGTENDIEPEVSRTVLDDTTDFDDDEVMGML